MALPTLRSRIGLVDLRTAAVPPKVAEPFYSSAAWIALRDRVRREANGRCQAEGCGRAERRMYVDHILELKDGGAPLDRSSVWLLCASHHTAKTASERGAPRGRGASDPWGFSGRQPHGGSRREFFPRANTSKNRPLRGSSLGGDDQCQEGTNDM